MKLDDSCISNPKFGNLRLDCPGWHRIPNSGKSNLRFPNFGFEMQDSSNFKISPRRQAYTPGKVSIATLPVLPPTFSTGTPILSMMVTSRLALEGLSSSLM